MQDLVTIEDLYALRAAGVDPHELIADWDITGELRSWAKEVAVKQIKFQTTHLWNEDRKEGRIHPSSLGTKCDFRLFLELAGGAQKRQVTEGLQRIFDMGTAIHLILEYYQTTRAMIHDYEYLAEVGHWKNSKIAEQLMMCGSTDGTMQRTFKQLDLNLRCLWEYKSSNTTQFPANKPKKDAVIQSHAYMRMADAPMTVILYYRKDDSVMQAFPVFFDWEVWQPVEDRISKIVDLYQEYKEPEKAPGGHCSMCPFLIDCEPPRGSWGARGKRAPRA